ncbi:MAG: type IV secretion system protein [Desulfovibrionaceae bacterium]|nr:type IV secretion system protein [Desulfovibrionaceae bacterium]
MFKKKTSSRAIDAAVTQSVDFEVTIADLARRSQRRAWTVAFSAIVLTLIMAGAIFYMMPLKQKEPYLIIADAATGVTTAARLTDEARLQSITTSEAINRSNVAHFVNARESYDAVFLSLHDWPTVLTMAAPDIAAAYTAQYRNTDSPDNLYQLYGTEQAIRVNILSIILGGGAGKAGASSATVRFQRSIYNKRTGGLRPLDNKIAMLEFTYKPGLSMDERDRLENPLGFQVTSYRVDNDFSSPAPVPVPVAPPPPPAAPPAAPEPQASAAPAPEPPPVPVRKTRRPRRPSAH